MFIASAILIRFYITVCIFQKRITPFVKKNIHIVHSPVGTPERDIVVDRILSYYIFSTRSYFGYLITCPCSFFTGMYNMFKDSFYYYSLCIHRLV